MLKKPKTVLKPLPMILLPNCPTRQAAKISTFETPLVVPSQFIVLQEQSHKELLNLFPFPIVLLLLIIIIVRKKLLQSFARFLLHLHCRKPLLFLLGHVRGRGRSDLLRAPTDGWNRVVLNRTRPFRVGSCGVIPIMTLLLLLLLEGGG